MATAQCLTCEHYLLKGMRIKAPAGFGSCALANPWTFFSPMHSCDSRKPAAADVASARTAWWAGKQPNQKPKKEV